MAKEPDTDSGHEEDGHEHSHDHENLEFQGTTVDDATLEALKTASPTLAENLELSRKFTELSEEDKERLAVTQRLIEEQDGWKPAFHAEGDLCAGCNKPTTALFIDTFANDRKLEYAATLHDLPVHPESACLDAARARIPRPAPQLLDRARRELIKVPGRPGAKTTMFFRHDILAHPPFGLEDWANSVAEANPKGLQRHTVKDIERLMMWVHRTVFH